jgi:type VI secretion system secreted protein VgrG
VYADQTITSGGHYSHTVGGKTTWKSGEKIVQQTSDYLAESSTKAVLKAPGGTIIIDGGGITLKGAVKIKGSLAISGGSATVAALKLRAKTGDDICIPCLLAKLKGG